MKNNRGRRLDHIWASFNYKKNIEKANIVMSARKQTKPSDHVPIIVEIKKLNLRRGKPTYFFTSQYMEM